MEKTLRKYLGVVFAIGSLAVFVAWLVHKVPNPYDFFDIETQSWWRDFCLNAGTGLITSVLVIMFYDRVLMNTERQDRLLRRDMALDSLGIILDDHFRHVLYGMYRCAANKEKEFRSIDELFQEEYYEEIRHLDFNKSPYGDRNDARQHTLDEEENFPRMYRIIADYNKRLNEMLLNEVLVVYGMFLDVRLLKCIQKIRLSKFVLYSQRDLPEESSIYTLFRLVGLISVEKSQKEAPNGFPDEHMEKIKHELKDHIEIFVEIVRFYNEAMPDNKLELMDNTKGMGMEWGICRVDTVIPSGTFSLPARRLTTNNMIIQKLEVVEKKLDALLSNCGKS